MSSCFGLYCAHFCIKATALSPGSLSDGNHKEEIGHVKIGAKWLTWCSVRKNLSVISCFHECVKEYFGGLKPPFNVEARMKAGMTEGERIYFNILLL